MVNTSANHTPDTAMWFHAESDARARMYAIVYGGGLLATFFPARQAGGVYPAEALRYE